MRLWPKIHDIYVGKVVQDRSGDWQFLAFRNAGDDGRFAGGVIDPVPVGWRDDGRGLDLADDALRPDR